MQQEGEDMNKRLTGFIGVLLVMTVILWSIPAMAYTIEVIPFGNNFQFSLMDIRPADTQGVYYLDRVSGTLTFSDGPVGQVPPSGQDDFIATYRQDTGQTVNVYPITFPFQPFLIPFSAFSQDDQGQPDLSFVIAGLAALVLETSDINGGVWVQSASPSTVPIPGAVWFLGSGLLGLAAWRYRGRKS
jgi:hypothetical protein